MGSEVAKWRNVAWSPGGRQGGPASPTRQGAMARILHNSDGGTNPLSQLGNVFRWWPHMQSPLVVDALREQLLRVLDWYHRKPPGFTWGAVIHQRNERGRLRFGAITPSGESMLLSEPLLEDLGDRKSTRLNSSH